MAGCDMHQTQTQPSSDSEEFSSFFDQLLHSSPPPPFDPNDSGSDFTRPDPVHSDFRVSHNSFQPSLPQNNAEASELSSKPPRAASSKRSRAAEFHNLSEKRRRSRINEKMKALQNLIPNSSKTDKASMLDEAIEYLKQLQLQVQMLMMRNGLSLHPMSLPGGMRPMLFPQTGMNLDDGNRFQNSSGAIASSANNESFSQHGFSFPKQCSISNQSTLMTSVSNIVTSDTSSILQPSIKDALYSNMPQVFLDTTKIVRTPSPDVS